jgi:hypothetical protein
MNFITTPGKVLPDIQSITMFLLMKYANILHFYSEKSWIWFYNFQSPGNGIAVNWIIMLKTLIVQKHSDLHSVEEWPHYYNCPR